MFLVNSRSHLVSAAFSASCRKDTQPQRRTFSRSYGTILPSSFTRVLSSALVFSTRPPVSVFSTVLCSSSFSRFSWKRGISLFSVRYRQTFQYLSVNEQPDLPSHSTFIPPPGFPTPGFPSLLRPDFTPSKKSRNINLVPIDFAFRLRLRGRLTLLRITWCRKPWTFGEQVFHLLYRYSYQHSHF